MALGGSGALGGVSQRTPPPLLDWSRLRFLAGAILLLGVPIDLSWNSGVPLMTLRLAALALAGSLAFALFERWPERLPKPLARWVLQVLGVALAMPPTTFVIWVLSTEAHAPQFWKDQDRLISFGMLTGLSLLLAPWTALTALVRQKEALARHQALAFDLERSELERQALDARLHLLRAQIAPHFLFNTLANVQALVDTGSPQAAVVLRSLTAYLRAAVPRLNDTTTTIGQELQLVQAYLELMHMRMPDRLLFSVRADDGARAVRCPPMTVLTLVENAVRHGIDPSEDGGRIDIMVERGQGRCRVEVSDTGIGLHTGSGGTGTGLSTLARRLALSFGENAVLRLTERAPHGVCAEVAFPAGDPRE